MKWIEIRDHYAVLFARASSAGLTQKQIADRGGLCGQNAICKLLKNSRMGPCAETLFGAIEGLGLTVPEFFLTVGAITLGEHDAIPPLDPDRRRVFVSGSADDLPATLARLAAIELQLTALQEAFYKSARVALEAAPLARAQIAPSTAPPRRLPSWHAKMLDGDIPAVLSYTPGNTRAERRRIGRESSDLLRAETATS